MSYNEFVPLCFNLLVERFKDQMLSNQALQGTDQLQVSGRIFTPYDFISPPNFEPCTKTAVGFMLRIESSTKRRLRNWDSLQMLLLDALEIEDGDATGMLPLPVVKASLTRISQEVLGLTRLQLLAVLSEVRPRLFWKMSLSSKARASNGVSWKTT